jgi:tRNA A37 threonylcarbamoyladenosine modification protein TsaB
MFFPGNNHIASRKKHIEQLSKSVGGVLEIWAAIDLSGKEACFSAGCFPEKKIIFNTSFQMRGRDSSSLLPKLEEWLKVENISLGDVKRWTAGTGPGNYTGLRIVSALVSGIVFDREDMRCRGIPSAYAIASEMKISGNERTAVIYPIGDDEIYSFGVTVEGGEFLSAGELSGSFSVADFMKVSQGIRIAALQRDVAMLPKEILYNAVLFSELPVASLVFMNPSRWDGNSVRDLIYIRPAVNVAPMSVRLVAGDQ